MAKTSAIKAHALLSITVIAVLSLAAAVAAGGIRPVLPIKTIYPNVGYANKFGFFFTLETGLPGGNYMKIVPPTTFSFTPTAVYWGRLDESIQDYQNLKATDFTISNGNYYIRFIDEAITTKTAYKDLIAGEAYGVWITGSKTEITEAGNYAPFGVYTVSTLYEADPSAEIIYDRNPIFGKVTIMPVLEEALDLTVARASGTNLDKIAQSYYVSITIKTPPQTSDYTRIHVDFQEAGMTWGDKSSCSNVIFG